MKHFYKHLLLAILSLTFSSLSYAQIGAIWETPTTGTLNGVSFTLTNLISPDDFTGNLTTTSFSAAPLSTSETCWDFAASSDWTVTFDSPISDLRLYSVFWRSATTTFDQPFTILSGTNLSSPDGSELSTTSFANGIIEFTNPITVLNTSTSTTSGSGIAMTFGIPSVLSINDNELIEKNIKLYPSNSSDFIQIYGMSKTEKYKIFNVLGKEINSGLISNEEKIDIQKMAEGIYFLKFENGTTLKFIKEEK